jgi:5-hydroxyisourate hydrolase-like protein (transthyretin family)
VVTARLTRSVERSAGSLWRLLIVAMPALALALIAAPSASAATGEITGTVTAAGGGALANIQVCAQPVEYETGTYKCEITGSAGDYALSGLNEGEYVVYFYGGLDRVTQYFPGKATYSEAEHVAVTGGGTASGIDAALALAGKIQGHITDAVTHAALNGIEICAVEVGHGFYENQHCTSSFSGNGEYTLGGLPAGSYKVLFQAGYGETSPGHYGQLNYLTQYFSGKEVEAQASAVSVSAGTATGSVDAAMQPGGRIAGTVTAASGGAPLQGVGVCASPVKSGSGNSTCSTTSADGTYSLVGFRTGEYKLRFEAGDSEPNYVRQFYSGKKTRAEADAVAVTAGQSKEGIDVQMVTGGKVTGTVTDATTHDPIEDVHVCVADYSARCSTTDAAGHYQLEGLPTGSYKIRFETYEAPEYLNRYYHGKHTLAEAESVAVSAGATSTGVDEALIKGAKIAGTVTDVGASPLAHISVCAREVTGDEYGRCTETDSSGEYTLRGLEAGGYKISFGPGEEYGSGGSVNRNYLTQYYNGKSTLTEAATLTVSNGGTTTGINATMHAGGRISGRVTAASGGAPVGGAEVCAFLEGGDPEFEWGNCDFADSNGEYAIEGLAGGSYEVRFFPGFSMTERNLLWQTYASPVSVTLGATHEHIDAALATGGQIGGHVVDSTTSQPVEGASACALEIGGEEEIVGCGTTNALGNYKISGLRTGSYKVEFSALHYEYEYEYEGPIGEGGEPSAEELYVRQFWNGSPTKAGAQSVAVTAGALTGGINASLVPGSGGGGGAQHLLSLGIGGSGSGSVSSSPAGIACSASCSHGFAAGAVVTLTPSPAAGSTFAGWSGGCTGTGPCQVTLSGDVAVAATFEAAGGAGGGAGGGGGTGSGGGSGGSTGVGSGQGASGGGAGGAGKKPTTQRCKKGFKKKKIKGKQRCVHVRKHRR